MFISQILIFPTCIWDKHCIFGLFLVSQRLEISGKLAENKSNDCEKTCENWALSSHSGHSIFRKQFHALIFCLLIYLWCNQKGDMDHKSREGERKRPRFRLVLHLSPALWKAKRSEYMTVFLILFHDDMGRHFLVQKNDCTCHEFYRRLRKGFISRI